MPKQTSKNIIVMEDDVAMAEIVTHKLESSGFAVRHAEDGKQGLQMISEAIPDLILLDLMMLRRLLLQMPYHLYWRSQQKFATGRLVLHNLLRMNSPTCK